jgi:hypothetical protein
MKENELRTHTHQYSKLNTDTLISASSAPSSSAGQKQLISSTKPTSSTSQKQRATPDFIHDSLSVYCADAVEPQGCHVLINERSLPIELVERGKCSRVYYGRTGPERKRGHGGRGRAGNKLLANLTTEPVRWGGIDG